MSLSEVNLDFKNNKIKVIPDFMVDFKCIAKKPNSMELIFRKNEIKDLSTNILEFMGT